MAKKSDRHIISFLRGLWAPFATGSGSAKTIVLCLVTAFIFWLFNSLNKEYSTRLDYPITFEFNRDSLVSVNELPSKVSINVTGGGWNLLRKTLGFSVSPIVIDLTDEQNQPFLTEYSLLSLAGDQLDELTINYIISDTIFIDIDEKIDRSFNLSLDTTHISLAENHHIVSKVSFQPDSVKLTGPRSIVSGYNKTISLALPDTEIDNNYNENIPVSISVHPTVVSIPDRVNVAFEVEEFIHHNSRLKISRVNFPENKVFLLSTASIEGSLYLPNSKVNELDSTHLKVTADYNNFNPNDSTILLTVNDLPPFVRTVTLATPSVKVIYQ